MYMRRRTVIAAAPAPFSQLGASCTTFAELHSSFQPMPLPAASLPAATRRTALQGRSSFEASDSAAQRQRTWRLAITTKNP